MVVIIGSGAGGAIIAMELALANIPVTLIEKGPWIEMKDAFEYYEKSDDGIDLLKTSCIGGSTTVAAGNGVRVLEEELKDLGISISKELDEVEKLLSIHEMDDSHFGKGTETFMNVAKELNLNPMRMPKFIRDEECKPCGKCAFGCPRDAKWTSNDFVKIAIENGAKVLDNTEVIDIAIKEEKEEKRVKEGKRKKVKGLTIKKLNGDKKFIHTDKIILSAGAVGSAILLQKIGLNAGKKLFMDSFVTVGGIVKGICFNKEVQMNALVIGENYILAPHYSQFVANELKKQGAKDQDIFSIMVKIPDDDYGEIKDGKVIKENTIKDVRFIAEGSAVAGSILINGGVDPNSIISTKLRGAHPGGTAAIGEIVDTNLETEIDGLFLSDASVLPKSPGAPPILTILALSKRLSKYLIANHE